MISAMVAKILNHKAGMSRKFAKPEQTPPNFFLIGSSAIELSESTNRSLIFYVSLLVFKVSGPLESL